MKPGVRIYLRIDDPVPLVPRFSCNREDVIIRRGGGGETEKREREEETRIRIHEETPSIVITHDAIQISQQGFEEFSHVNSA